MIGLKPSICVLLSLVAGGGCSVGPARVNAWVREQGGIDAEAARQARLERMLRVVSAGCEGRALRASVLATDRPSAFSWRSGQVFVTRGLIDLLDDEELAAALDHELGHLLSDGHVRPVAGLKGCEEQKCFDAESRADETGVRLLESQGIAPGAMARMLIKVKAAAGGPAPCQAALEHRIELLESRTAAATR